jgi:hypothetical protein
MGWWAPVCCWIRQASTLSLCHSCKTLLPGPQGYDAAAGGGGDAVGAEYSGVLRGCTTSLVAGQLAAELLLTGPGVTAGLLEALVVQCRLQVVPLVTRTRLSLSAEEEAQVQLAHKLDPLVCFLTLTLTPAYPWCASRRHENETPRSLGGSCESAGSGSARGARKRPLKEAQIPRVVFFPASNV